MVYHGLHTDWSAAVAVFRDMSTTCRRPVRASTAAQPWLTMELGVSGIGYDEVLLPDGDGGGGGEEQDDDDEEEDDDDEEENDDDADESVLSVSGADGERVAAAAVDGDEVAASGPVG